MNRRTGLTLLELVVVLAIIAVLIGLMLGAVQKARRAALEVERVNWHHQRKLGVTVRRDAPIKILFIGNSFTSTNDLPGMLRALAEASGAKPQLIVDSVVVGGARLKMHWDDGAALRKIRADKWDFVVLQEQSQTPLREFGRDEFFYPYARQFAKEIRERKSIPLFFLTWSRPDTPGPQKLWTDSYVEIAKELEAELAPAGMTWERVQNALPGLRLYADRGGHPTPVGTYLAACTFYATIYDRDPTGLPRQVSTPSVQVTVSQTEAITIQRAAWEALQDSKPRVQPVWR